MISNTLAVLLLTSYSLTDNIIHAHTLSSPPIDGFKMRNSTVTIDEEEQVKVDLTGITY